jgi:alkaline phosphatase
MKLRYKNLVCVFIAVFLLGCANAGKSQGNFTALHQPKNVIIMIADGAGFNHFKAADYYQCGRSPCQPYEDLPVRLAMSTYPDGGSYDANLAWHSFDYLDKGTTDSAAAATAMATGVKTYNAGLGVDVNKKPVLNLVERAEQLGKATGVITTVFFDDATPAGFVVHNGARSNLSQIADDMVNKSSVDVIMGAGHPFYDSDGRRVNKPNYKYIGEDSWAKLNSGNADANANRWTLIQTRDDFQRFASGPAPKRVFGLAQVSETLQEKRSGDAGAAPYKVPVTQTVPTLEEMTKAALNVLDDDPNGFFVMIEGGAVDWAAHSNYSGRLIEEMNDFSNSIKTVVHWVNKNSSWNETLVIITADHETGYLTGPGSRQLPEGPVWNDLVNNGPGNLPTMEWHSGSHTNSLVPFFAKGAGAEQFKKTIDGLVRRQCGGYDPIRGPFIDNTDIAKVIFTLWSAN